MAGSSRGIGLAIATALAAGGSKVAVTGRNEADVRAAVESLGAGSRATGVAQDLSTEDGCRRATEHTLAAFGRLDMVFACVGFSKGTTSWDAADDEWHAALQANLMSAVRLVRAAVPALKDTGGSIVVISSIAGVETLSAPTPYSAAKAALNAAVSSLARPLAAEGIRINAIAPGNVLASGGTWERRMKESPEDTLAYVRREVPMGRFGRPEEIADVALFLASAHASFVTGTCIVADGGQTRSI